VLQEVGKEMAKLRVSNDEGKTYKTAREGSDVEQLKELGVKLYDPKGVYWFVVDEDGLPVQFSKAHLESTREILDTKGFHRLLARVRKRNLEPLEGCIESCELGQTLARLHGFIHLCSDDVLDQSGEAAALQKVQEIADGLSATLDHSCSQTTSLCSLALFNLLVVILDRVRQKLDDQSKDFPVN